MDVVGWRCVCGGENWLLIDLVLSVTTTCADSVIAKAASNTAKFLD